MHWSEGLKIRNELMVRTQSDDRFDELITYA